MTTERIWPDGLLAYKRTPEFTEASVPAGLLRRHSTKPGVRACLHVEAGRALGADPHEIIREAEAAGSNT